MNDTNTAWLLVPCVGGFMLVFYHCTHIWISSFCRFIASFPSKCAAIDKLNVFAEEQSDTVSVRNLHIVEGYIIYVAFWASSNLNTIIFLVVAVLGTCIARSSDVLYQNIMELGGS